MVEDLKYTSISICEIIDAKLRLEANVFNVETRKAKEVLKNCKWNIINLWSEEGLVKYAFYPGRFKRVYVEKGMGYPMILPSQMREIKPQATKFISEKTFSYIGNLQVNTNTLLISRSGTIGNCTIVSNWLNGFVMSDDIIRVSFKEMFDLGFVYTYLLTDIGRLILATNNYGAVIKHIEPEHLENVEIPNPPKALKEKIHNLIIESFDLRDQSNTLLDKAEKLLVNTLHLPPIEEIQPDYFDKAKGIKAFSVGLNVLNNRFDASYHTPVAVKIFDYIFDSNASITRLDNKELSKYIIQAGRFKRNYVESNSNNGIVFLGGKQLLELDPSNKKYLSLTTHGNRIEKELFLKENMIAVTCSGTIGKVNIIPKHWENWTMSQHVLRIVPSSNDIAGYLYVWLNTDYGKELIKRLTYGAVIDEIEAEHLAEVPVPILKDKSLMKEINDLALRTSRLRTEAYYKEQEALKIMNEEVIYASK